jgi:peptidoglycan/LPS O-acetylase OafA/YrhL
MSALARLPGLDGLRGVAVLAVIGYHLNLGHFLPAGFLGVDIFFTVSGFIITALLLQEHAQSGRIDFPAFYLRRARRLFPAALAMLLLLVPLTPLFQPAALSRLREDLPAAFLYLSNWWQIVAQQSYFEAIEQPRLLQHLWSLAVEEQYYLLWPLAALWLLNQTGRAGLGVAAGWIAAASTGWMAWLYTTQLEGGDPSRVYLGTDTHLMGLLAGSALAAWWNPWKIRMASQASDEILNLAGIAALAALIWGMAETHEGMPELYQGGFLLAALLTCVVIGAATREGTWVAWLLSCRPMLWLGARSYSLYLWHWPVVVWLRPSAQADALELTWVNAARLVITLLCAEASYRWVETRWTQNAKAKPWRRSATWAFVALLGVNAAVLGLMPGTTSPQQNTNAQTDLPASARLDDQPGKSTGPQRSPATDPTSDPTQTTSAGVPTVTPPQTPGAHYQKVTLVGDSVLLGASPYLQRRLPSASVEAKVGRQGSDGLKLVQSLRQETQLGDATVIHLGTNGYLAEKQFRALLEQLSDRKTVVVLNVYGARRWTGPNNELIGRLSQSFDNVRLIDWHAIGQANPGYFVQDGIHLSGAGIHAYYNQIRMALGQPEVVVSGPTMRQVKRPPLPAGSSTPVNAPAPASSPVAAPAPPAASLPAAADNAGPETPATLSSVPVTSTPTSQAN